MTKMRIFTFLILLHCAVVYASDNVSQDISKDKSGAFLGLQTGYGIAFKDTKTPDGDEFLITAPSSIAVGFKVGYTHYFFNEIGLRGYFNYNYNFNTTHGIKNNTTAESGYELISLHHATINADVLYDFYNSATLSFGTYLGIALGYGELGSATSDKTDKSVNRKVGGGFILPLNLGLSLIADKRHRVDLNVEIPTFAIKYNSDTQRRNKLYNVIGTIGYSYTF